MFFEIHMHAQEVVEITFLFQLYKLHNLLCFVYIYMNANNLSHIMLS